MKIKKQIISTLFLSQTCDPAVIFLLLQLQFIRQYKRKRMIKIDPHLTKLLATDIEMTPCHV